MRGIGLTPRSGSTALSMFSVNTWLIIICVAVFMADRYLPRRLVPTGQTLALGEFNLGSIDSSRLEYGGVDMVQSGLRLPDGRALTGYWRPIFERGSHNLIGWQKVHPMRFLESHLHFSTALGFLSIQYWRFIGFQFLHANSTHLIFNMIGLFFFGSLVEQYLGSKRYLAFYLLCGIFGALMYLALNLGGLAIQSKVQSPVNIPGLLFADASTPLVGASAGIFGVIMAGAYLAPRATVYVFFILPMQLRTMAYALIGLALFTILFGGHNAGGEAGHLGGAIAGWYFIRHPQHLHGFFDFLGRADPTSHHYRRGRPVPRPAGTGSGNAEIDRILDKISVEGIRNLTDDEKRTLSEASRRGR